MMPDAAAAARVRPCVPRAAAVPGAEENSNVVGRETHHPDSHETFVQVGCGAVRAAPLGQSRRRLCGHARGAGAAAANACVQLRTPAVAQLPTYMCMLQAYLHARQCARLPITP